MRAGLRIVSVISPVTSQAHHYHHRRTLHLVSVLSVQKNSKYLLFSIWFLGIIQQLRNAVVAPTCIGKIMGGLCLCWDRGCWWGKILCIMYGFLGQCFSRCLCSQEETSQLQPILLFWKIPLGTTGCPVKLSTLWFCYFLGFQITYRRTSDHFSIAQKMRISKLILLYFLLIQISHQSCSC